MSKLKGILITWIKLMIAVALVPGFVVGVIWFAIWLAIGTIPIWVIAVVVSIVLLSINIALNFWEH